MRTSPLSVLIVEDSEADALLVVRELQKVGLNFLNQRVDTEADFLAELEKRPDFILCDYNLPQFSALRALEILRQLHNDTPFIIVSGSIGEDLAVEAMKKGASDYLMKDRMGRLGRAVTLALEQRELRLAEQHAKRAEREATERLNLALAGLRIGVWEWNLIDESIYWSPESTRILELVDFDGTMSSFQTLIHPEDFDKFLHATNTAINSRSLLEVEFRVKNGVGDYIWVANFGRCDYSSSGKPLRLIGILHSITERKKTEESIREGQARLRAIGDNLPDGAIYQYQRWPDEKRRFQYFSRGCEQLFGISAQEALEDHTKIFSQILPEDLVRLQAAEINSRLNLTVFDCEFRIRGKESRIKWLHARTSPRRQIDGSTIWDGVVIDLTRRMKLEEEFRQAQKMEAIGQLAGGVAHDFNNLLTIINGYSDLMMFGLDQTDPNFGPVSAIRDAGERATRLTAQLLAFSRKTIIEPKVLDLNEVVSQTVRLLGRLLGEDILIATILSPRLSLVKADPGQIEQVVMNLAVNARDAMPKGGRLTIETRDIEIGERNIADYHGLSAGNYVMLCVSDTGSGMTDEVKAKIFEPFFTTKEVGKGTGLGLATVFGIVKTYGGDVKLESEVGVGTKFEILIPAIPPIKDGQPSGEIRVAPRGAETILLVEDEAAVLELARIALQIQGYSVLEASNGATALRLLSTYMGPIHLVVMDVVMPGMTGPDLANALLAKNPKLRILYMSGYTNDAIVRNGVREQTDAFIQKPFTPLMLARKVREILDSANGN